MTDREFTPLELEAIEMVGEGYNEPEATGLRNALKHRLRKGQVAISRGPHGDLIFTMPADDVDQMCAEIAEWRDSKLAETVH